MKFIISKDGTITINSAFVRTIYLEGDSSLVNVIAELDKNSNEPKTDYPDCVITLSTFNSGNLTDDYKAAQAYLAGIVAELNGGKA